MQTVRLKQISLRDVGPFNTVVLDFPPTAGVNLLCGDNGIGKTTILEAIAASFSKGMQQRLKKRSGTSGGSIGSKILVDDAERIYSADILGFDPSESQFVQTASNYSDAVINIRTERDINYRRIENISRDPPPQSNAFEQRVMVGLNTDEIKSWFINRYIMSAHRQASSWTPAMDRNLGSAQRLFSILDTSTSLQEVNVTTLEIIVKTPSGLIPFEYLSSGFRSTFSLFLGIIKEIEFRRLDVSANEFSGIILIDEIELHLHPSWQRLIGDALRQTFPNAQIICTTHSPHIVQTARSSDVVALGRAVDGSVFARALPSTAYGYVGWTLEEVLQDVMGVSDTKTTVFRTTMLEFDQALDTGDSVTLKRTLSVLRDMLHPSNPLRKLVEIQAAPMVEGLV